MQKRDIHVTTTDTLQFTSISLVVCQSYNILVKLMSLAPNMMLRNLLG